MEFLGKVVAWIIVFYLGFGILAGILLGIASNSY